MTDKQSLEDGDIVVGYDGSEPADGAVRWAADQAVRTGSTLDLVIAWEYPTSWGNTIPLPDDYDPVADAQAILDPVVETLHTEFPSLEVRTHVLEGNAGDVLVDASHHATLLVVASRGHRTFAGLVLGSVSQHCVTHAACPVVVYREPKPAG
jgi:nucleotide-binding universal stress UspA family protein